VRVGVGVGVAMLVRCWVFYGYRMNGLGWPARGVEARARVNDDGLKPLLHGRRDRGMATVAMEGILVTTEIDNDIELPKKRGECGEWPHVYTSPRVRSCEGVHSMNRRVDEYDPKWRVSGSGAVAGI
jgi:hypothetical protein